MKTSPFNRRFFAGSSALLIFLALTGCEMENIEDEANTSDQETAPKAQVTPEVQVAPAEPVIDESVKLPEVILTPVEGEHFLSNEQEILRQARLVDGIMKENEKKKKEALDNIN